MTNEQKHDATYGNPDWCNYWGIDDFYDLESEYWDNADAEPFDDPSID